MASRKASLVVVACASTAAWVALLVIGLKLAGGAAGPPAGWKEIRVQIARKVRSGSTWEVHFAYQVDGRRYTGVVHREESEAAAYEPGRDAPAAYLPGSPAGAVLTAPPAPGKIRTLLTLFLGGTGVLLVLFPWAAWLRRPAPS